MKHILVLVFALAAVSASAYAFSYDIYGNKGTCEDNNGFWCYRCQGTGENIFNKDTCVASSLNCTYSCSTVCGAGCSVNSQCASNLTSDSCQYAGACSSCNCVYAESYCPQNGTIANGFCYYGARYCGYTGCSVNKCLLATDQVCDPATGCVQGTGQPIGEMYEDYRCSGSDVYAKKTTYMCNATACSYSKYDTLVERCPNGCIDGQCDDGACSLNGLVFDCNRLDGFYTGRYCNGNDVYREYRNYTCGNNECAFVVKEILQESCSKCSNGACTVPDSINGNNNGNENNQQPETIPLYEKTLNIGKRIYNGWLFGHGDLVVSTQGRSGTVSFTVTDTNNFGALSVTADTNTLFYGKPGKGTISVPFTEANTIIFTTTSSGWLFFAPATYDIRYVTVEYA